MKEVEQLAWVNEAKIKKMKAGVMMKRRALAEFASMLGNAEEKH